MTIILLLIATAFARPAFAQGDDGRTETLVKAAYLFHFCGLVTWPASAHSAPDSPIRIGIAGDDRLADEVMRLAASKSVQGRALQVIRMPRNAVRGNFHLLYLDDSVIAQQPALLASLRGLPVLTVTDAEHGLASGAVIRFANVEGRMRFEISQHAAALAGLDVSTRLLAVSANFSPVSPKFRQD